MTSILPASAGPSEADPVRTLLVLIIMMAPLIRALALATVGRRGPAQAGSLRRSLAFPTGATWPPLVHAALRAPPAARMLSMADKSIPDICRSKIQAGLDAVEVKVDAAFDDPNGSHISIYCVAAAFEGKNLVQRQQLVYKQIWDEMQGPVHAVDGMVLKTPGEAGTA